MNEETPSIEAQAVPDPSIEAPELKFASAGAGLPRWLPLAALAIVPAVIVGLLVLVLAGGGGNGGSSGGTAGVIDGFLRLQPNSNQTVRTYKGQLPPDLPSEFPVYQNAKPIVSYAIITTENASYFSVLTTSSSVDDVFKFFTDALDSDPWQVEAGQSGVDVVGLRFSRPDNADVSGVITIHHSELDNSTSIFLTYEDVAGALAPGTGAVPSLAGQSFPMPPGFPSDVPVYEAGKGTTVIDSFFQRGQGGKVFQVVFLTKANQDDVISYYTKEFEGRGWTTTDTSPGGTSFAVSIDFSDVDKTVTGQVSADTFVDDADYTRVELAVQVTAGRSRGN